MVFHTLSVTLLITGSLVILQQIKALETNDGDVVSNENKESNNSIGKDILFTTLKSTSGPCPPEFNGTMPYPESSTYYFRCEMGASTIEACESGKKYDQLQGECHSLDQDEDPRSFCTDQVDGLYPNYTSACQQNIRCRGGRIVNTDFCPTGYAFSFNHQACLPKDRMSCVEPVCHQQENAFYRIPGSFCQSYYYCQHGTAHMFTCPEGLIFNEETKGCTREGSCFEPICTGRPDGDHPDTTSGCHRFLRCKGGDLKQVINCPTDQLYDGYRCSTATAVQCESPENTSVAVDAVHDDCGGYSDGLNVIMGTSCRRYQLCRDDKVLARLKCPLGHRFNGQYCGPQQTTPCQDSCKGLPDGYNADHKESCRKYQYCRNGETMERRSCPEGSLFSGHMCLPSPLVTCKQKQTPPTNPCQGLPDGFHADYLRNCRQYYYCSGYKMLFQSSCSDNMVWNGTQCVQPKDVTCLGPRQNSQCHGRKTGLYQDMSTHCSRYYYCHNGNQTMLSCAKGKVFNGENCVSSDQYSCPSHDPNTCYNKQDGYYTEQDSGCRGYYYCSHEEKISYVCPSTKVFNGTECVDRSGYKCEVSSKSCTGKIDGYYPDISTMCRTYFYCKNEQPVNTFHCEPKKLFDGSSCVTTINPMDTCKNAS